VTLVTHTDLDGTTAIILAKKVNADVKVYTCDYDGVDDLLTEAKDSDVIYVVDLGLTSESVDILKDCQFFIFDHHVATSRLVGKYDGRVFYDPNLCGAELFYNYLVGKHPELEAYADLVRYVTDYDTWKHEYQESQDLNLLLYAGYPDSVDAFIERFLNNPSPKLTFSEKILVNTYKGKRKLSISYRLAESETVEYNGYRTCVVVSPSYTSEIAKTIFESKDVELVIVVNTRDQKLSFRSRDKVDCSELAERYGGGGHYNASGAGLSSILEIGDILALLSNRLRDRIFDEWGNA